MQKIHKLNFFTLITFLVRLFLFNEIKIKMNRILFILELFIESFIFELFIQ